MGYVVSDFAAPGPSLGIPLRGRTVAAEVVPLPFTPHRYKR
jgi:aminomethyltransferase